MALLRPLFGLALLLIAGCGGDDPEQIILRWSETFEAEPSPPGLGPEQRLLIGRSGSSGALTTHEQASGLMIEGPHPTFPTAHAPVTAGGNVYIVSTVGRIVGLAIGDGSQKAIAPATPLGVTTPLVAGSDDIIRVGSTSGRLFAMQPDGTEVFDVTLAGPIDGAPVVDDSGTTYAAVFDPGRLIGVSATGEIVVDHPVGPSASGVSIGGGLVAVGHGDGVTLLDSAGAEKFVHPRQARVTGTLIAGGRVLAWGEDGKVELLDDSGGIVWTFEAGPPIYAEAVALPNGNFAVFDSEGTAYLLDGATGEQIATYALPAEPKFEVILGELDFVYLTAGSDVVALDFVKEE